MACICLKSKQKVGLRKANLSKSLFIIKNFNIMKTFIHLLIISFFLIASLFRMDAQLIVNGTSDNFFAQPDNTAGSNSNWIRSIGIGYFGSGFPNSFLHINSNIGLIPDNGSIANYGEVFRTSSPANETAAWRMFSGNVSANEKFNIRNTTGTNHVVFGTVQSGHLDFHTGNAFRGRLTSDGALYFSGTFGANPDLGAGTRLMWVPSQAAFRAGRVTGSEWDSGNVGFASFAAGQDNLVSGDYSFAGGWNNTVSTQQSFALGSTNEVLGLASGALGHENDVRGPLSFATGKANRILGLGSFSLGCFTNSEEDFSFIIGTGASDTDRLDNYVENSLFVGFNSDIPTLFVGPSDGAGTYGHVGVNTTSPEMLLHVHEGGILATTTESSPTTPDLGQGTRFIWMPDLGALRAGYVVGNEWNPALVGENSVAFGQSSIAVGEASFAAGHYNNIEGLTSMALGRFNVIENAGLPGRQAIAAFTAGRANYSDGDSGIALGLNNSVYNQAGVALGEMCEVTGVAGVAGGFRCESHGEGSIAFGHEAIADADFCIALGSAYNDIEESMLVGFPTIGDILFAGPGASGGPVSGVGIGGIDEPTERLDVDGNARFRDIPSETPNVLITGVEEDAEGDYSLSYLAFSGDDGQFLGGDGQWHNVPVPPAEQCDWEIVNSGADMVMGYHPTNACVPGSVGIGTATPTGKLTVVSDNLGAAVRVWASNTGTNPVYGIVSQIELSNANQEITAVRAHALNNGNCDLVYSGTMSYGVNARANNGYRNFAVYAEAIPHPGAGVSGMSSCSAYAQSWAGYFNGATFSPGAIWHASDESLKTVIGTDTNASELLENIDVAQYVFNHEQYQGLHLPDGEHWGVLANQLSEVLPNLVTDVMHPAQYDEDGNQTSPSYEFKAVNYTELIPILIAGHKEQQSKIDDLAEQVAFLTELVAACCEAGGAKSFNAPHPNDEPGQEMMNYDLRIEQPYLGQNVPNPFMTETSITYRIPEQAMVRVRVMDAKGQQVDMLVYGLMPKGEYRIVWNASHLPAGLYFYTLEADGVELVKKAVKL
jgi:hypothetical protein